MHTDHAPRPGSAVRVLTIALALIAIANGPASVAHAGGVDPTTPATSSWWWAVVPLGLALGGWAVFEIRKRHPANKKPSTAPSMGGPAIRSSGGGGLHDEAALTEAERHYKARLAELSIKALSAPLFPGKKDGDPNRPAGNDTERDLAIQKLVATDMDLITLVMNRSRSVTPISVAKVTISVMNLKRSTLSSDHS